MTTPRRLIPQNRPHYTQPAASLFRKDRSLCSHPLYCAVCHAPGARDRRHAKSWGIGAHLHRNGRVQFGLGPTPRRKGCPRALALSSERGSTSLPSVCRLPVPGDGKRSVPLGTLLSSGSLSHTRVLVGRWTEVMGGVWGSLGRPTPPGDLPFPLCVLRASSGFCGIFGGFCVCFTLSASHSCSAGTTNVLGGREKVGDDSPASSPLHKLVLLGTLRQLRYPSLGTTRHVLRVSEDQ